MEVVNITDGASPLLKALILKMNPNEIGRLVGLAVLEKVKAHLVQYDADHPNKLGGQRTNYYATAAANTTLDISSESATISVVQTGINQRIYGGRITPKNSKYLTIPACAEAYAKRAGQFPNLIPMIRRKNGVVRAVALVEAQTQPLLPGFRKSGERRRGAETGGKVYFWLVAEVNQIGEPGIVPSLEEIEGVVYSSLDSLISSQEELSSINIIDTTSQAA